MTTNSTPTPNPLRSGHLPSSLPDTPLDATRDKSPSEAENGRDPSAERDKHASPDTPPGGEPDSSTIDNSYGFDPNELIARGDGGTELDRIANRAIVEVFGASRRHPFDVRKFSFDDGAVSLDTGQIRFTVERDDFRLAIAEACEAMRLPSRGSNTKGFSFRLCLSASGIKIGVFDLSFFYETTIYGTMSGLADGQSVAVALDLRQAKKFAATLGSDDNLTGLYHAKRRSLEVRSDLGSLSQVKRWFATEPADELRNVVLEKFGEPSTPRRKWRLR
jgi:hypothetical protein